MNPKSFLKAAVIAVSIVTIAGIPASPMISTASGAIVLDDKNQDEKAVKIIETMIEKLGGREKLESIKSVKQTGTISIPMVGISGVIESYTSTPDKFLLKVDIPAIGKSFQGLNGEIAWSTDPMGGPRLLSDEETNLTKKEADLTSRLDFREEYPTIQYVEETEFDGQRAHKIRLVDTEGEESMEFYSIESGLQIGSEADIPSQMGKTHTVNIIRGYKELEGHLTPTTLVQKIGPTEIIITIESVKYNQVDDTVYAFPPAIEALIDATRAREEAKEAEKENATP